MPIICSIGSLKAFNASNMSNYEDFSALPSNTITEQLGKKLEQIRLSQNISQADLAEAAGVSRSTMTRIADGKGISLDSFIRVMQALGLANHLAALLPDPSVRPVERAKQAGKQRRRASRKSKVAEPWTWGDDKGDT